MNWEGEHWLCMTEPSMMTRVPALHSSSCHPGSFDQSISGSFSPVEIKVVPPSGLRVKREWILFFFWLAGRKDRQPLEAVQSSNANQNPRAEQGSVYRNLKDMLLQSVWEYGKCNAYVESSCMWTEPPMRLYDTRQMKNPPFCQRLAAVCISLSLAISAKRCENSKAQK